MKSIAKKITTVSLAALMGVSAMGLTGCSKVKELDLEKPVITVMLPTFATKSADANGPVVEELERYVAEKLGIENLEFELKWSANSNYGEKVTAAMGSDNWPHIMLVTERTSTIIQNSRANSFWDLTDELKAETTDENGNVVYKYPNLAETDDIVNHNISIDGRIYGVYRAREVGRAGVTIRKDWVDNLYEKGALSFDSSHLGEMTMAEFEELLYAFKNGDPDNNGQDDTYGMIVAGADYLNGPLLNLVVWNGAPNGWGYNSATERIEPAHMFEAYEETLTMMRKWKADGVINKDMDTFNSNDWNRPFLQGEAGVIIDVADRARRVAQNMMDLNPNAEVDVFGYVSKSADEEPRTYPTSGYSGYFVLPTKSVKTEEERDFLLKVLDICNDEYAMNLMNYGLQGDSFTETKEGDSTVVTVEPYGKHYAIVDNADGTQSAKKTTDDALLAEYADLNQFLTSIKESSLTTYYSTPIAAKVNDVYEENKLYKVPSVAEAYVSDTYSRHSTQLDPIISAANTKYISGAITLDAWKAERDRWYEQGGEKVIKEMNEFYDADTEKLTDESIKKANHKLQYEEGITKWLTAEEIAEFAAEAAAAPKE